MKNLKVETKQYMNRKTKQVRLNDMVCIASVSDNGATPALSVTVGGRWVIVGGVNGAIRYINSTCEMLNEEAPKTIDIRRAVALVK